MKTEEEWEVNKEYYCIIETISGSRYVEGDQRSRDAPGHGYPAGYETFKETYIHRFTEEKDIKNWIKYNENKKFIVIKAQRLGFTKEIVIGIT